MNSTAPFTAVRNPHPVPSTTGNGNRQRTGRPHKGRPAAEPTGRRFDRVTIGFWLGGLALALAGCIYGACMPYRHPVGVTISILWWGIYVGCLGASIGAGVGGLFGLWRNHTLASPTCTGTSDYRRPVQAATGADALADPVTSPVLDDRKFETFIGGLGI